MLRAVLRGCFTQAWRDVFYSTFHNLTPTAPRVVAPGRAGAGWHDEGRVGQGARLGRRGLGAHAPRRGQRPGRGADGRGALRRVRGGGVLLVCVHAGSVVCEAVVLLAHYADSVLYSIVCYLLTFISRRCYFRYLVRCQQRQHGSARAPPRGTASRSRCSSASSP